MPRDAILTRPSVLRLTILGVTGSVGSQTADIIAQDPDAFDVMAVTAHSNVEALVSQAKALKASYAVIAEASLFESLKEALLGTSITPMAGNEALREAALMDVDMTLSAIVGTAGVMPTLAAASKGHIVALANKESLVCAGALLMEAARKAGTVILPVDSEHHAIFQLLQGRPRQAIASMTLTASGGPFRTLPLEKLPHVTIKDALNHPTWNMGDKISIDSATMMNKGFEVIEAMHLFDVSPESIKVVIHPQSIIHGCVEFTDHTTVAHMSHPDMKIPISHALYYPEYRSPGVASIDVMQLCHAEFFPVEAARYPALELAYEAMRYAKDHHCSATLVLNVINDLAVDAFLKGMIGFTDIAAIVAKALEAFSLPVITHESDVPLAIEDAQSKGAELLRLYSKKAA
jgi:1-deoxy-D-xylulose-5-phosphate reductoisomerase